MGRGSRWVAPAAAIAAATASFPACGALIPLDDHAPPSELVDGGEGTDAAVTLAPCTDHPDSVCTLAPIPDGWSAVAYASDRSYPCPGAYAARQEVVADPQGDAVSCTCACAGSPKCYATLNDYGSTKCNVTPSPLTGATAWNDTSTCMGEAARAFTANDNLRVDVTADPASSCTGSVAAGPRTPVRAATLGVVCATAGGAPLAPCAGGVCVPAASPPYLTCIVHAGDVDCPAGFGHRTVEQPEGTAYADTRGCAGSSCDCQVDAGSCGVILDVYEATGCGGTMAEEGTTSPCVAAPTSFSDVQSWRVHSFTGAPACVRAASAQAIAPTGTVGLSDPRTVCCPG